MRKRMRSALRKSVGFPAQMLSVESETCLPVNTHSPSFVLEHFCGCNAWQCPPKYHDEKIWENLEWSFLECITGTDIKVTYKHTSELHVHRSSLV